MKEEKLKDCESQNSLKGRSTLENSKISERIKSSKHSLLSKENLLPKKAKKIVIIKKLTKLKKNKPTEKQEKPKQNGGKLKEIKIKLTKTTLRTKLSNKITNKKNFQPPKVKIDLQLKQIREKRILMSHKDSVTEKDQKKKKIKS